MAQGEVSGQNMPVDQSSDEITYHQRVAETLKPLENRWEYVQSVLLWEKPIHTLLYFVALNMFFWYVTALTTEII